VTRPQLAALSSLVTVLLGACALTAPSASARATHLIAYVRPGSSVALLDRPFGHVVGRVGATTPFGSRRALGVMTSRRRRWLAVTEAGLGHNRIVWVDAQDGGLRYGRSEIDLDVDLSTRTLVVHRKGLAVRTLRVDVGRPGSPTPSGRFAVTDKLDGRSYSPFYGCCILALSATQPNLPRGWRGGSRIAIHGTPSSSGGFGHAVSTGCLHASARDLRYLMRIVRLGTPVVIRR
jgi:L,D-transpeptidase-like protein